MWLLLVQRIAPAAIPRSRKKCEGVCEGVRCQTGERYGFSTPYLGRGEYGYESWEGDSGSYRQHRRLGTNIS